MVKETGIRILIESKKIVTSMNKKNFPPKIHIQCLHTFRKIRQKVCRFSSNNWNWKVLIPETVSFFFCHEYFVVYFLFAPPPRMQSWQIKVDIVILFFCYRVGGEPKVYYTIPNWRASTNLICQRNMDFFEDPLTWINAYTPVLGGSSQDL